MTRFALALAACALPMPAMAAPATYEIDPTHVVVAFTVGHIGYAKVLGRFTGVEGTIEYDAEAKELGEVSVTIDAMSVDTDHDARDGHVRAADFLDAEAHPQITFTANGGTPTSDTTGTVTGDLTIRGVTMPVTLDVTLNKVGPYPFGHKKETIGFSATTTILRGDFGSTYAAPMIVSDEVGIMLEIEAVKQD